MASNEETNAAGTDTRPPMLVESDYDSWKIRIHRYIRGKPLCKLIWNSIQNCPSPHPMVTDDPTEGQTGVNMPRMKLDSEFTPEETNRENADTQAEIILIQVDSTNNNQLRTSSNSKTHAIRCSDGPIELLEPFQRKLECKEPIETKDSQYFKDKCDAHWKQKKREAYSWLAEAEAFLSDVNLQLPMINHVAMTTTNIFEIASDTHLHPTSPPCPIVYSDSEERPWFNQGTVPRVEAYCATLPMYCLCVKLVTQIDLSLPLFIHVHLQVKFWLIFKRLMHFFSQFEGHKLHNIQSASPSDSTTSSGPSTSETPKVLAPGMYNLGSKYIPPPKRANWVKPTPLPKKKQVTFHEPPRTSNRPTQKPPVQQNKKPNVSVNLSTRTKPATESRKPMPKSHTRNHRILPSKSVNARRAADHNRKLNFVNHNQFVIHSLKSVNTKTPQAKHSVNHTKKVWKATRNHNVNTTKTAWRPIGKVVGSVKPQWKPTGRHFVLYDNCPLTRIMEPIVEPLELTPSVSSSSTVTMVSRFLDYRLGDRKAGSNGISAIFE
ncbi:hypothetical protein Tco_1103097 [Tanacetum coccineum]